ncbi:MAG: sodium-dependent transporter [Deltaproteobacteria bacterium]|nr:sodium-dependent transporter [Nannocystaceae bacterium]
MAAADQGERWGTRLGVILAVSGSAVGLGNFLRFPGNAAQHGGGAFMIPYFIALLLVGIPVGWAEWTMGRYGGRKGFHSAPGVMGVVGRGRLWRYLGVLGLLVPMVVYMYYGVVEAWCLQYAWAYASGGIALGDDPSQWVANAGAHFDAVSGTTGDGVLWQRPAPILFLSTVIALNAWFVWRGLSGGIETFCKWAMPAMAICATIVLVRVLTLGTPDPAHPELNVANGLGHMWNPDLTALGKAETWLAAAGQIFFSLSVGFGVVINYASYLRRSDDVVLSGLTAAATNEVFEVGYGGLITITAAFVFLGASGTIGNAYGLGFATLPVVFAHMGGFGQLVGALWFFMLFLAAITSSLSMLQPVKAFLHEALGVSPGRAVAAVVVVCALGSLWTMHHSRELLALDTLDFWVGTAGIFALATAQTICFGWVFGIDRGFDEAHQGARMRIPSFFRVVVKYIAPAYLLAVFGAFCWEGMGTRVTAIADSPVVGGTVILILVSLAGLLICTRIGELRWRALGLDLDGEHPPADEEGGAE